MHLHILWNRGDRTVFANLQRLIDMQNCFAINIVSTLHYLLNSNMFAEKRKHFHNIWFIQSDGKSLCLDIFFKYFVLKMSNKEWFCPIFDVRWIRYIWKQKCIAMKSQIRKIIIFLFLQMFVYFLKLVKPESAWKLQFIFSFYEYKIVCL